MTISNWGILWVSPCDVHLSSTEKSVSDGLSANKQNIKQNDTQMSSPFYIEQIGHNTEKHYWPLVTDWDADQCIYITYIMEKSLNIGLMEYKPTGSMWQM